MLTDQSRQKDFPSLEGVSYLNTAAEGIPPRDVVAARLGALDVKPSGCLLGVTCLAQPELMVEIEATAVA